jgi:aquaporin rerated protein, other eukaryote
MSAPSVTDTAVMHNGQNTHNGTNEPKTRRRHSLRHPAENSIQAHLVAAAGEFVGTFLFLYLSYMGNVMATTHVSPAPTNIDPTPGSESVLIISLVYGFSLLVNVWAFYRISGGLFNPAVSRMP